MHTAAHPTAMLCMCVWGWERATTHCSFMRVAMHSVRSIQRAGMAAGSSFALGFLFQVRLEH